MKHTYRLAFPATLTALTAIGAAFSGIGGMGVASVGICCVGIFLISGTKPMDAVSAGLLSGTCAVLSMHGAEAAVIPLYAFLAAYAAQIVSQVVARR